MHHDVVIVGAGSAGCVLANRLSADDRVSVLLVEAGGSDRHPNVRIPAAFSKLFRTRRDWNFNTQPEPHLGGRSLYLPRGRMLGGSHSMNAMLHVRGDRADFDGWRDDHGCVGWGWDDVLGSFKRSEHSERGPDEFHGIGGPLNVADLRTTNPLTERFLAACEAVGIPPVTDFDTGSPLGAGPVRVTQKDGARFSVVDGYLAPARRRPNLTVLTDASVQRVLFDGDRAVGVEYADRDGLGRVGADEVVLSAGAFGSPHLLQLSGVGPADHLRTVGVDPVADLPGVGANLQDHPIAGVIHDVTVPGTLDDAETSRQLLAWATRRRGSLTSPVAEALAFCDRDGDGVTDLQFYFAPGYYSRHGFDTHPGRAFSIGATLVAPTSRGTVRLRSADPTVHPDIVGNVLSDPAEVAALVDGVRLAVEIARSAPFDDVRGGPIEPASPDVDEDGLVAWIRRKTELIYHPVGTVAMGASPEAPIDPVTMRVKGLDGIRVVDASVMPRITRANTNAPTIMIAEHAADRILGLG